jgi:hypothetical protein
MKLFIFFLFFSLFISCSVDETIGDTGETPDESEVEKPDDTNPGDDPEPVEEPDLSEIPDEIPDDFQEPEPFEFSSPDPKQDPLAIIVTIDEFYEAFTKHAAFHTVTGIPTEVVTIEEICIVKTCNDNDPKNDTAKAVKDFIMQIPGLKYLVIGGDIEIVPSRRVYDSYSHILAGTFEGEFYTDFYYSDFSNWDSNNNGIYAEKADNLSYMPDIAVGRIPASEVEEVERYFLKVLSHMTAYEPSHVKKSALLANVATEMSGIKINAGYYFETEGRTRDLITHDFAIRKIYSDTFPFPANDAEKLNNARQKEAMESGTNLIIHNGHGYPTLLSCEQSTKDNDFTHHMAYELQNTTYPVFLSCACQAGQFEAPFEYTYEYGGQTYTRKFPEDAAGEMLINAPLGGAIAYLGNTTTGLGLAGGSQLIDEMIRSMFFNPRSILGDSLMFGLTMLKKDDTFAPPIQFVPPVKVVDENSWKWTKKSVVLLGSPLITFWRDIFQPVNQKLPVTSSPVQGGTRFDIDIPVLFAGHPLKIYLEDGTLYTLNYPMEGTNTIYIEGEVLTLHFGADIPGYQYFYQKWEN